MPSVVRSFCKVNLGLAVGPMRPDGFHELVTLYQTLGLHDRVTVTARSAHRTTVTLEADHPGVPCTATGDGDRNTATKMVVGALNRMGLSAEVHLRIEKSLPVQGGLGAGSANAAAALLGLERELGQSLEHAQRLSLAEEVGSDVPLFLLGGTVLGLGRGEAVSPLPDSPALPIVLAIPDVGVSTAQAFRDLDARLAAATATGPGERLTSTAPQDRLKQLSRVLVSAWTSTGIERVTTGIANLSQSRFTGKGDPSKEGDVSEGSLRAEGNLAENPLLALVRTGVENDFEEVAFRQHPSLRDIKRALDGSPGGDSGALYAALSGSGSALFGVYSSLEAALEAQRRVQATGTKALLTETLTRTEYWRRMFA